MISSELNLNTDFELCSKVLDSSYKLSFPFMGSFVHFLTILQFLHKSKFVSLLTSYVSNESQFLHKVNKFVRVASNVSTNGSGLTGFKTQVMRLFLFN